MAPNEGQETLTPEQIEKAPEGLDSPIIDLIRNCTSHVVALNQQAVEDEIMPEPTKPGVTLDEFKAALSGCTGYVNLFDEFLPALYASADAEGRLPPRALWEFAKAVNKKYNRSDLDRPQYVALNGLLKNYDSDCIAEERTFTKQYILELMVLFALSKKIDPAKMKIVRVRTNKEGVLLMLEAQLPNADGKGYALVNYAIKGRNSGSECKISCLEQAFYDENDEPYFGKTGDNDRPDLMGPIAEYKEGKWSFRSEPQ